MRIIDFIKRLDPDYWVVWLRKHLPGLWLWDITDDQTHVHHTMVVVLLFGGVGWLCGDFGFGIVVGWLAYGIREILARIVKWRFKYWYKPWDGIMDVVVPVFVTADIPYDLPEWTILVRAALLTISYVFLRPSR